ncbi:aspartate carbamoyltransferase [candidate division MSBL1 archaeon SCGC-AAA261D19]|uniref:Aspartate carbamoyltransferase n=1 Tax=candidate division MSBL1 archaeon SCGC-AAA261D19 TaxID=1698273 RepID=A0A133V8Y6_9EURY|nr:aspartate carbamoyltransferase [candidate division MSBL1 archaeon SCGC-AAA261D19]
MSISGRDIITLENLSDGEILQIFETADKFEPVARGKEKSDVLEGKIIGALFFEPSTRTRLSFKSAAKRLGGGTIGFAEAGVSSTAKGESLADTVRTVENYCDAIILRHPKMGSAKFAAEMVEVPVINAGDGAGHHPTQTLLDLYTMRKATGDLEHFDLGLVGDLKYGRTVHSLAYAITRFIPKLFLISPPSLKMPSEIVGDLSDRGVEVVETSNLEAILPELDILYVTRIQKERFPDPAEYEEIKGTYRVDPELLQEAKPELSVLHPLPRVDEISPEVDSTPYSMYFDQVFNGVIVRMALLSMLIG